MKKIGLVFILALLLFALGIQVSASEALVLTPEIEAEMIAAYCATNDLNAEDYSLRIDYYGAYDGCYVGFIYGGPFDYTDAEEIVSVAGADFWYPTGQQLEVCKDGAIKSLKAAYDAGWLTSDAVYRLWNYYTNGVCEDNPNSGDLIFASLICLVTSGVALPLLWHKRK